MENLTRTIDTAVANKDFATLTSVFSGFAGPNSWQSVGQGEQRSIAAHFIVTAVNNSDDFMSAALAQDTMMDVFLTVLSHLPATVEGAADNVLRQQIFAYKTEQQADYIGAARVLAGMRMEDASPGTGSSVYAMTAAEKTDVYVKIAECFLAEDELAEADAATAKAGVAVEQIDHTNDKEQQQHTALILRYKSTYARVLDANRKFLAAASRYHELSQSPHATDMVDENDLLDILGRAATCAILAPSGPQRQRVLGHIANDERLPLLDGLEKYATHSTILKKMYTHQVLRPDELTQFEASLAPHQKAVMGDGLTIMERGIVEHNMIAVSNLYQDIYITELAYILGVAESKAEQIAASMIMDGSLHGSIDQVAGLLEFETDETAQQAYDRSVTSFCMELNRVTDAVKAKTAAATTA